MPEGVDSFTFDKGLNIRKNPVTLADGELQNVSGFSYVNDGQISVLTPRVSAGNTQLGVIRNIHRSLNWVYVQEGSNLKYKWDLNGYCDLYVPPNANFTQLAITDPYRCRTIDYKTWTFIVNGFRNLALNGQHAFDWAIPNPTVSPSAVAGSAGNPNGTYTLYYTFLFKFPNGEVYETGPSPSADVTVSSQAIAWKGIGTCPYAVDATVVKIYRRLYRYSATLAAAYYVTDIQDNTTTTYTDDFADASINTNDQLTSTEYGPPPDDLISVETYLQRIFWVKNNQLGWSEPYLPFSFKTNSAINVSSEGDNLTGIGSWGDVLYMSSRSGWFRLTGTDPNTWGIRFVFADKGIINKDTFARTRYGLLGLWYDGICLFDGSTSRNITEKILGMNLFLTTIGRTNYASCWATWDGTRYYFYYPSNCLVIDFTFYPELRIYHDPLILTAHEYHDPTGIRYMGYDGYQYMESTSGISIPLIVLTGEKAGGNILQRKNVKFIYYDIDTGGLNVIVTIYVDGVAQTPTFTINTTSRTRQRITDIPQMEGYRISLGITCVGTTGSKPIIYGPWAMQLTPVGV